ncbi:dihydrolipoyl dehydrogenase [Kyrpidia tusciae]|uniref:Dihydrolipoyl dehydrogenase n=1 Tax=Kyrpidia tusciae (strain DSM 2912 / NBRC 15312 / T2) TaxID=562970 RepID=D5WSY2_KYRT2|nr:dihydrolipoyl dehydrogenase [Kyrpidia tusciae]ADG05086.1 dihydrolipoamide dehydrogenase [Kyrpidia tusciae DSM 2912]
MVVGEFTTEVDLLIIGGGPGGYVAAIRAAQLGKKVTLVERDKLGGVCLNVGCIPSKALIAAAHRYEDVKKLDEIGIQAGDVRVDFAKVQTWKQGVVDKLTGGVASLMKANKVEVIKGEALFANDREARVINGYEANRYRFNQCIIATGSRPIELKDLPFGGRVISSTEALSLQEIPRRLLVIGGGYIGIELGTVFAKFGTQVTVLEGTESILPTFEKEVLRLVERRLKKLNVTVVTSAMAKGVEETADGVTVTASVKGEEQRYEADYVLVTVGRRPNTEDLGLDMAGVRTEKGLIQVDKQGRTSVGHIFAVGDVVPGPALAHKASYEGKVAAEAAAGEASEVDYRVIPAVVFSDPEIAVVGLSESEAKEKGLDVVTGRFPFAANGRALSLTDAEGFVKLVADKSSGELLGAQIVGPEASDLIAEAALAIEMGATLEDVALTIHAHPTLGEVMMEAAEVGLGRPVHIAPR